MHIEWLYTCMYMVTALETGSDCMDVRILVIHYVLSKQTVVEPHLCLTGVASLSINARYNIIMG